MPSREANLVDSFQRIFNEISARAGEPLPALRLEHIENLITLITVVTRLGGLGPLTQPIVERNDMLTIRAMGDGVYEFYITRETLSAVPAVPSYTARTHGGGGLPTLVAGVRTVNAAGVHTSEASRPPVESDSPVISDPSAHSHSQTISGSAAHSESLLDSSLSAIMQGSPTTFSPTFPLRSRLPHIGVGSGASTAPPTFRDSGPLSPGSPPPMLKPARHHAARLRSARPAGGDRRSGIMTGSLKIFKSGIIFFAVKESLHHKGVLRLLVWKKLLSLSKKSGSYAALGPTQEYDPTQPDPAMSSRLLAEGFDPFITTIIARPTRTAPISHVFSLFVEDLGIPLDDIKTAKKLDIYSDFAKIAQAIILAGHKNPPALVPFDIKPGNIVVRKINGTRKFAVIDWGFPSASSPYISERISTYVGRAPGNVRVILNAINSESIDSSLSTKPGITITMRKALLYITAETIIHTFVALLSAQYINTKDDMVNEPLLAYIKQNISPYLLNLPQLFVGGPPGLAETIDECLANLFRGEFLGPELNLYLVLKATYIKSLP